MRIVISLGGSLVVPDRIDINFLKRFKSAVRKCKHKIVIVVGGGRIARDYIHALGNKDERVRSLIGMEATRLNALLVSKFLDNETVPDSMMELKKLLRRKNLVVCSSLGYKAGMTSDGTAADVARNIKADMLINMTNVKGLYDKDPRRFKDARFIPEIGFEDFLKMAEKIRYEPGQHFVLDQIAARTIKRYKIKTIILKEVKDLKKCLKEEKFTGTIIS